MRTRLTRIIAQPSTLLRSLSGLGLLVLLLASCSFGGPLREYSGTNILETRGAGLASGAPGYLPGPAPGVGYESFDYIALEALTAAEYGTSEGLPAGARVYRLELLNLLPDGDFEASTPGNPPISWEFDASSGAVFEVAGPDTQFGAGNYLVFTVGAPGDYARIDLDNELLDGLVPNAVYGIRVDLRRRSAFSSLLLDYGDSLVSHLDTEKMSWLFLPDPDGSDLVVERFPRRDASMFDRPGIFHATPEGTGYLYVGSPARAGAADGYLDNLSIVRMDTLPHWALPLPAAADEGLELVPGRYRLRLFVKAEIASQVTPAAPNRFRADRIALGANNLFAVYTAAELGWGANGWVEVTHEFQLLPGDLHADPTLTLQITPLDLNNPSAGSILISSPVLELAF